MINIKAVEYKLALIISLFFCGFIHAMTIDTSAIFLDKLQPQMKIPANYKVYNVRNVEQVYQALDKINKTGGYAAILFADGIYHFRHTLNITSPNLMLLSKSGTPYNTILRGNGMKVTKGADNLIRVAAPNFVLDGLTLEQVGNHLVQIAGESGAKKPTIRNSILQNGYEQLIKVTYSKKDTDKFSNNGLVENCLLRYTRDIGPNFYIGGIDAHGVKYWLIQNNIFENIASPSKHIAEHAIHLWNDTFDNTIRRNLIINSDRGIGFGMRQNKINYVHYSNYGGVIQDNIIYHAKNNHKFSDVGIILEDSPFTIVKNNVIFFEHNYPYAIEFRFESSVEIVIKNNNTNRGIRQRNNANAIIINNKVSMLNKDNLMYEIEKFKLVKSF